MSGRGGIRGRDTERKTFHGMQEENEKERLLQAQHYLREGI